MVTGGGRWEKTVSRALVPGEESSSEETAERTSPGKLAGDSVRRLASMGSGVVGARRRSGVIAGGCYGRGGKGILGTHDWCLVIVLHGLLENKVRARWLI